MIVFRRLLELPKYALAGMIGGLIVVGMGGYTVYVQNAKPHLSATVEVSPSPIATPDVSPTPIPTDIPTPIAEPVATPIAAPIIVPTVAPVIPTAAPVVPSPIPSPVPIASVSLNVSPLNGSNPLSVTATANFVNMPASFNAQLTVNGLVCSRQVTGTSTSWGFVLAPLANAEQQVGNYYDFVVSSSGATSSMIHVVVCPAAGCAYSSVAPASTASIKC